MNNETGSGHRLRGITRWATTRPQAYGVYLLAVVLVWVLSFYAGTLKPKKAPAGQPVIAISRN